MIIFIITQFIYNINMLTSNIKEYDINININISNIETIVVNLVKKLDILQL